ncbi:hypothetical protein WISP_85111 [Willisornis vidua]|uniref:Uncharacterized protein n=1 Tax=Willisornis vidua TaxID=1566151 RepID=A0ABQ9D3A9_9PASS|nr:hypothetical protein WISP_85111 [Willisornis vidua]
MDYTLGAGIRFTHSRFVSRNFTRMIGKTPTIPPLVICEAFPSTVNIITDDANEDISFTAFEVLKHSTVN